MANDPIAVVQAILKTHAERSAHEKHHASPVVTFAYDYGSGGDDVLEPLAKRLGVGVYDREVLHSIAEHCGGDPALLEQLDEKVRPKWNSWLQAFTSEHDVAQAGYYRHLVNCVLGLLATGGIIVGRGANVILAHHPVFRVRVVGSLDRCAQRIANRESVDFPTARRRVEQVNHEKAKFVWDYFRHRHNDPTHYDLVVNTDHYPHVERVVDLIVVAMQFASLERR